MLIDANDGTQWSEAALADDRAMLVRFCARLTASPDAAQDLAHETLLEAWRIADRLHDPAGRRAWLAAIARNVCLRWLRRQGRERRQTAHCQVSHIADGADFVEDLERDDLLALLDRALLLVPDDARQLLVARYVDQCSSTELAQRLGTSEDALSMRLSRAKRTLRQVIETHLRAEAATYGLCPAGDDGWRATRIWCPVCGQRRLDAHIPPPPGTVSFRCVDCSPTDSSTVYPLTNPFFARLIGGLSQPRAVMNRSAAWCHSYYQSAIASGSPTCTNCAQPMTLQRVPDPHALATELLPLERLELHCAACGEASSSSFRGLVGSVPEVQRLWRAESRIHMLPEYTVEVDGRAAIVSRVASVTRRREVVVISARDTYQLLRVIDAPVG